MRLRPESPRARRRFTWIAAAVVVAAAGAAVVLVLPSKKPPAPAPLPSGARQQLAAAAKPRIGAAERRAIDATLDRFVPEAVAHKNLAAAWKLDGPELRSAQTYTQWLGGTTAVPYYPAADTGLHDWRTIDNGRGYVIFNILIHPTRGAKVAPYEFSGEMVLRNGHWLVNRLYTIAIFNRVTRTTHEIGPADFAAPAPSGTAPSGSAALGAVGLAPLFGVLGLGLLVVLAFGVVALVRARRWRRLVRETGRTELPPLPKSYLRDRSERPETLSRH
jgi:hypothetical protein